MLVDPSVDYMTDPHQYWDKQITRLTVSVNDLMPDDPLAHIATTQRYRMYFWMLKVRIFNVLDNNSPIYKELR